MTWEPYLGPGERLVWTGQPRKSVRRWPGLALSGLGLPFLVASYLMLTSGIRYRDGIAAAFELSTLFGGIVFAGFGLYLTLGIWILEATRHRRIRYALTDRAAYAATGTRVDRVPLTLHRAEATLDGDGGGSLRFGPRDRHCDTARIGFEDIADAAHVAKLVEART
jgi:hypothetical protein